MVRVTTQETFDGVVKENEEDLGMDHDEAVQDAIKQFKAQGVDLTNIITTGSSLNHAILNIVKDLGLLLENPVENVNVSELKGIISNLKSECDIDIARKVLAGKNNAYSLLIDVLEKFENDHDVTHLTLTCLTSLMSGQPDLLNDQGIKIIVRCLKKENDAITQQALRWTRQCCLKHESNRQMIMEHDIGIQLNTLMAEAPPAIVRYACMVMRSLVLDDDIRVPFGKAHEHARLIACDYGGLKTITQLLNIHKEDLETVNELLSTLGALVVREEFCREVEECGGLNMIMDIMVTYPDDEKLNRQSLKLLKGLAGSDNVKLKIVQAGAVPLLISAMVRHQSSVPLFTIGCLAVAAIALRSPTNSELLCDCGAAEAILQGMREHAADINAQKACSLAIRNIVSRKRELSKQFLESGAEELLRASIANHGSQCEGNAKDALRDLGCEVHLTERWTGKNVGITH